MFFSTGVKLYHSTQNLRKWNKYFFPLRVAAFVLRLREVHLSCVSRDNITWPHGHSNILDLRTCTMLLLVAGYRCCFSKSFTLLRLAFPVSGVNPELIPGKQFFCGKLLPSYR